MGLGLGFVQFLLIYTVIGGRGACAPIHGRVSQCTTTSIACTTFLYPNGGHVHRTPTVTANPSLETISLAYGLIALSNNLTRVSLNIL